MKEFINPNPKYDKNKIKRVEKYKSPSPRYTNYNSVVKTESDNRSRCTYIHSDTNRRCKNFLGLYPQFCSIHTLLIHNLHIGDSKIPGASMGLFTGPYPFKKGTIIGKYNTNNNSLTLSTFASRCETDRDCHTYVFCDDKSQTCWDSKDIRSSILRFINDNRGSSFNDNCYFQKKRGDVLVIASKTIKPYSELYVQYGDNYWD